MYETFTVSGQEFCKRTDPRTKTPCISSIHPYDETEYHWARREPIKSDLRTWHIYRNGERVTTLFVSRHNLHEEITVAEKLLELDKKAKLHRTGGIY